VANVGDSLRRLHTTQCRHAGVRTVTQSPRHRAAAHGGPRQSKNGNARPISRPRSPCNATPLVVNSQGTNLHAFQTTVSVTAGRRQSVAHDVETRNATLASFSSSQTGFCTCRIRTVSFRRSASDKRTLTTFVRHLHGGA